MTKIKLFVSVLTVVAVLFASLIVPVNADGQVSVRIRVSCKDQYRAVECYINIVRLESSDIHSKVLSDNGYKLTGPAFEKVFQLDPGFYCVTSSLNDWSVEWAGRTDVFEVKGDQMTVYVPCGPCHYDDDISDPLTQIEYETIPMPDTPIVYGEDNTHFGWWEWKRQDDDAKRAAESELNTSKPNESTVESSEEPTSRPDESSEIESKETSSKVENESSESEPNSKKIGNIIFYSILAVVIIGAAVGLLIVKKRRNA